MKTRRVSARGQTLVEYALILPLMLLILVMLFDLGRAVYYYSVIHNAAREGARYGIIDGDPLTPGYNLDEAGIIDAAENLAVGLDQVDVTIIPTTQVDETTGRVRTIMIEVIVTYDFEPATPIVGNFLDGGTIFLQSTSTMNVEY